MAEKKLPGSIVAVDPEAQAYIRDLTKPHVQDMIMVLVEIAKSRDTGARDRMKAAIKVVELHARGTTVEDQVGDGKGATVVVVNTGNREAMDEAAARLRELNKLTHASKS